MGMNRSFLVAATVIIVLIFGWIADFGARFQSPEEPSRLQDTAKSNLPDDSIDTGPDRSIASAEKVVQAVVGKYIHADRPPSIASTLAASLDYEMDETARLLDRLEHEGHEPADNTDRIDRIVQLLQSKSHEFQVIEDEVRQWIVDHEMEGSVLEKQLMTRFAQIEDEIDQIASSATSSYRNRAIRQFKKTLKRFHPSRIGFRGEPQPTFVQDTPTALTPDDMPDGDIPRYMVPGNHLSRGLDGDDGRLGKLEIFSGQKVLWGYLGIDEAFATANNPFPGSTDCQYEHADLANALPEVDTSHPDIQALAKSLGYSPIKIYEYVSNQIEFQPYYGSLKGAVGTLKSGSGNSTDQASLFIALLRASNIPARFVQGVLRFAGDDSRMLNWLGTKSADAANSRLRVGKIPTTFHHSNIIDFTHVWVEACVPYGNYRGSRSDYSGYQWIPLDPSFKEMRYTDGTTVADIPGYEFDYDDYLSTRTTTMPHEALRDQMESVFGEALKFGGGYQGTIVQKRIDILPSTLPYEVIAFKAWSGGVQSDTSAIPRAHRYYAEFELKNAFETFLVPKLSVEMPLLATKRLTLSFKGVNNNPLDSWNGLELPCAPYSGRNLSADMQAVFKLDGEDITPAGPTLSVPFCSGNNKLNIRVVLSGQNVRRDSIGLGVDVRYRNIGAHNYHALQAYAFQASEKLIEERSQRLLASIESQDNPNGLQDEILGEYLHIVGLKYMGYYADSSKQVGQLHDETGDSGHHIGLTSTAMKVEYLFDLPFAVSGGGLLVDVPGGISRSINIETGDGAFEPFLLSGYAASAYESYIWQEHAHLDAVSSVRGIQFANDTGTPVVILESVSDVDSKLNQGCSTSPLNLNYPSNILDQLKGLFNQPNRKITIPNCLIHYENWLGAIWVSELNTGVSFSAGYTISGDYVAGGGYAVGSWTPNYYVPSINTGYRNIISTPVIHSISRDSGARVSITPVDRGVGSNSGNVLGRTTLAGDPVNLVSGNFYHPQRDINIRGRGGLDFVLERVYNSNIRKDGPMGYGWTHSFNHQLKFFDESGNGLVNQAIWIDGSGSTKIFDVTGNSGVPVGILFSNQEGVYDIAKRESNGEYSIREKNGLTFHFENIPGANNTTAKLLRIVDRNGNMLRLNYSGGKLATVSDDINRSLTFFYDDNDQHITRITDWSGRTFRYHYNNNDLIRYESPLAVAGHIEPTTYSYYTERDGQNLDHAMKAYQYPNGYGMTFEYYTNGKVFRHTDNHGQSFTIRYNKFRRETTTIDERGIKQTYIFNEWGQQLQHVQGDGSRLKYEYDDSQNPLNETTRRHALGFESRFSYDSNGNLIQTTLPDNTRITNSGYNAYNQPAKVSDGRGNYTLFKYDNKGNQREIIRLKKGVNTDNPTASQILSRIVNTYTEHGDLKTSRRVRDFNTGAGPYLEYRYDSNKLNAVTVRRCGLQQNGVNNLVEQCVSANQTFDALGRGTEMVDGGFYPNRVVYDANGRAISATDETFRWRQYGYDGNGNYRSVSLLDAQSNGDMALLVHDTTEFDALNRPIVARNIAGFAVHTEYDEVGNVIKLTNPDGYHIHFEYDELNRPTSAYDEHGHAVNTDYDIGGRPLKVTDPNGNSTRYDYYGKGENGQLRRVTSADNRFLDYFYDDNGNVIRTRDNGGRETLTDYDALNRPVRTVGPVHNSHGLSQIRQVTLYRYNELGYVTRISAGYTANVNGQIGNDIVSDQAVYGFDDFGRMISETDANNKTTRYVYDKHGNLTQKLSANGHIVEFQYDHGRNGLLSKRIAKVSAQDNQPDIATYDYNALGQVTRVVSSKVTYHYRYDQANRLESVTDSRGNKTLTYDRSPGGLLNSIEDSEGHRNDFLYDAAGRITAMLSPGGERVNFIFDAGGRIQETYIDNGYSSEYSYDKGDRLTNIVNRTAQGIVSSHQYGYDPLGRRQSHDETIAGVNTQYTYGYDDLDRLTAVFKGGGTALVEDYSYDQFGNRRTRHANNSETQYYQYDAAQQLKSIRNGSDTGTVIGDFQYDERGNLIQRIVNGVTRNLSYDGLDRLTQVTGNGIAAERYHYDDQDRRIEKNTGTATQRYLYDGLSIWSEYASSWNAALAHYSYTGLDQPIIRETADAGATRFYHQDGLGSAVAISDKTGVTRANTRFDAWGNTLAGGAIPRYGYTGREPDATGFIYYRARYYDPTIGRFTQRDPAGFADGINPYSYVANSPQNFTDPLGLAKVAAAQPAISSYPGADNINRSTITNVGAAVGNAAIDTFVPGASVLRALSQGDFRGAAYEAGIEAVSVAAGALTGGAGYFAIKAIRAARAAKKIANAVKRVPGCCCFDKGTPVLTSRGFVSIENIRVGDMVYSQNPDTKKNQLKPVTQLYITEGKQLYELRLKNTEGDIERVKVTDNHPYWVKGQGWIDSSDLKAGLEIRNFADQTLTVVELKALGQSDNTYNFTVAGFHNYFAGRHRALVHNCTCGVPKRTPSGGSPALKGDAYHPDSVAARQNDWQKAYGGFDAKAVASDLGYGKRIPPQRAPFNSHGQPVYSNGKGYISPDIDGHNVSNGWKMFDRKGRRIGTWNSDLSKRLKD